MQTPPTKAHDFLDTKRDPDHWEFRLTDRDIRILEHLYAYDGVLADYQIIALEFTGARQARDRLGKLFHNGYITRTNAKGRTRYGCMVYWLAERGIEEVAGKLGMEIRDLRSLLTPRFSQVTHDLLVNDFTLALQKACEQSTTLNLIQWINEGTFRADPDTVAYQSLSGKPMKRNLIPDRYFVVERILLGESEPFRSRLLLELDNATHPNPRFADEKVLAGLAYMRSEQYARRFGERRGRFLVVTTSDRRLKHLKETTERAAGERNAQVFYFTTFDRVTTETILAGEIWQQAGRADMVALFAPK